MTTPHILETLAKRVETASSLDELRKALACRDEHLYITMDRQRCGQRSTPQRALVRSVAVIPSTLDNSDTPAKYVAEIAFRYRNGVKAGMPAPAAARRQRKRSLTKVCEAARKAGADRVIVDGIVIALSPAAAVPNGDGQQAAPVEAANPWDSVLPAKGDDHGPH